MRSVANRSILSYGNLPLGPSAQCQGDECQGDASPDMRFTPIRSIMDERFTPDQPQLTVSGDTSPDTLLTNTWR
jgi:hypothetical protein